MVDRNIPNIYGCQWSDGSRLLARYRNVWHKSPNQGMDAYAGNRNGKSHLMRRVNIKEQNPNHYVKIKYNVGMESHNLFMNKAVYDNDQWQPISHLPENAIVVQHIQY